MSPLHPFTPASFPRSRFARQTADNPSVTFDPIIANPGRLTILTALLGQPAQDFVTLRGNTKLTDGNLTTHARKLASAGLVSIEKSARAGRPVTTITLTPVGRQAFERHVTTLTESMRRPSMLATASVATADEEEPWID